MYFPNFGWCVILALPVVSSSEPSFRDDYVFDNGSQAFYKEHTQVSTWPEAVKTCAAEGAQLAAPTTEAALRALRENLSNETVLIWIGIHSLYAPGYFITLNGVPTSKMYINWGNEEPNNWSGDENCVELYMDNLIFNDRPCTDTRPFICQKDLSALTQESGKKGADTLTPFFRDDYTYESAFRAFYKGHRRSAKWSDAVFECAAEGAELAAPDSEGEMRMMLKYMTLSKYSIWNIVWLGIHDQYTEGTYITLNGTSTSQTYMNWAEGEPNNVNGDENCVRLIPEGVYYDDNCERKWRFICKKHLSAVTTTNPLCETYDTEYVYSLDADRCYKVHTIPRDWYNAFKICQAEGSYLGIINSQDEVKIYKNMLEKYAGFPGWFNKSLIHLGFNDLLSHGEFITLDGKSLQQSGYDAWSGGQPDNAGGNERCGSLLLANGKLNDVSCHAMALFVCEKNIRRPISLDTSLRYGGAEIKFCT